MSEQRVSEKNRAEKAQEKYLAKQSTKEKKAIKPMPFLIGALAIFVTLSVIFAIYIVNSHMEDSIQNANNDLQTMSQIGTFEWQSSLKDAPWAIVYCKSGDFVVNSSKTFTTYELRDCSYKLASDVRIELVENIWSTKGKIKFAVPSE